MDQYYKLNMIQVMQEKRDNPFIPTSYSINDTEFFCEIRLDGEKSTANIYDGKGRLRVKKMLNIPAHRSIAVVEDFILAYNSEYLTILKVSDMKFSRSVIIQPDTFKEINYLCYCKTNKLLFFCDERNRVYKIEMTLTSADIKEIYKLPSDKLWSISKMGTYDGDRVYLFFKENSTLIELTYDWEAKDRLCSEVIACQDVLDVYFKNGWKVIAQQKQGEEEINYQISNNKGGLFLSTMINPEERSQQHIMKVWNNNFVLVNEDAQEIILIWNTEMFKSSLQEVFLLQVQECSIFEVMRLPNFLIFEVVEKRYNTLAIRIQIQAKLGEEFKQYDLEMQKFSEQENDKVKVYLANNIHLVFNEKCFINSHFVPKVLEFCELDQDEGKILNLLFLQKLMKQSNDQITLRLFKKRIQKLTDPSKDKQTSIAAGFSMFLILFNRIVNRITSHILPQDPPETVIQPQNEEKEEIRDIGVMLENMVGLLALVVDNIRNQQLRERDMCGYENEQENEEEEDVTNNFQPDVRDYEECLYRVKSIYLATDLLLRHRLKGSEQVIVLRQDEQFGILNSGVNRFQLTRLHQLILGEQKTQMKTAQILDVMARKCCNFYHAAYFYLLISKHISKEIDVCVPYLNDQLTLSLLNFMASCSTDPHFAKKMGLMDRENKMEMEMERKMSGIGINMDAGNGEMEMNMNMNMNMDAIDIDMDLEMKGGGLQDLLPKIAAKALIINDEIILRYLLYLCLDLDYRTISLSILSSLCTHPDSRCYQKMTLIVRAYVLCNRVHLGYQYILQNTNSTDDRKSIDYFIDVCLHNRKISDLLNIYINLKANDPHRKQLKQKMEQVYGQSQIASILELM